MTLLNTLSFKGFTFNGDPQSEQYVTVRTGPGDEDFANVLLSDLRTFVNFELDERIAALEAGESGGSVPSIWPVARTMSLTGAVTGSATFDGSQNFSLSTSIADGALSIAKTSGLQTQLTTLQTNIDGKANVQHTHTGTQTQLNSADTAVLPAGVVMGTGPLVSDSFTNPLYLSVHNGTGRASQIIFDDGADELGFRRYSGGAWRATRKIWTEANFDPATKASTGGNIFTGLNTFANGRVAINASTPTQAPALQINDSDGSALATLLYNRQGKNLSIRSLDSGVVVGRLDFFASGLTWNDQTVWHAGNFNPAAANYLTATPTLYNASAAINCDNLAVGTKVLIHNANTNTPGSAATYWYIETMQLGDAVGSLIQRAHAMDSSENWTRVYNAGWKSWRRSWNSENFNPTNKLDANAAAASAQKLSVARTVALTGAVTGSASFDGSANLSIATAFDGDVTNSTGSFIASAGGALQVNNPNALTANVRLDWNGNNARLRVGGTGTGSAGLFQIVGASDNLRMSVDSAGNGVFTGNLLVNTDKAVYHSGNLDLTDFTRQSTTNLGKTAGTSIGSAGLGSQAAWSNLPTGYSSFVLNTVGTANGAPENGYGYFHKVAQRDSLGGWAGLWLPSFVTGQTKYDAYIGGSNDSTTYGRWAKLWNSSNHGAGSGLDADLLDGKDGGYYLNQDSLIGGTNLARNGSFQQQATAARPTHWVLGGNATGRSSSFVVASAGPAGTALRIEATSAANGQYVDLFQSDDDVGIDARASAVPNRFYTGGTDFRGTEGAIFRMFLQFYDSSNTLIATSTSTDFIASATVYQRAFVTGRAPANSAKVRMFAGRLHNSGLSGATIPLFVEMAASSLQEGDSKTSFVFPSYSFLRSDESIETDVRIAPLDGRGMRFWDNDQYKIHMSASTHATWGGRIAGETTSDYNMYFRMSSGTNRGFVFETAVGSKLFSINPNGVRSVPNITAPTFIGALTGNASTASSAAKLTTARTINGVAFDGTANITVPASWNGGSITNGINIYAGSLNTQTGILGAGWNGGNNRWLHVLESTSDYAIYGYDVNGGSPYQQVLMRNTSLASGSDKTRAFQVNGGIKSSGSSASLVVSARDNPNAEYHAYIAGTRWTLWRDGYGDMFSVDTDKGVHVGYVSSDLNSANNPQQAATMAAYRAWGNYGGGYGMIDGSSHISLYSVYGDLQFGFGEGSVTTRASLQKSGTFYAADYAINSDESLKEHVVELLYNGRLRPVEFDWIEDGRHDLGFIAQDVLKIYPDAVQVDPVSGKLRLSPMKLISVLSSQINTLEDRLERLEALVAPMA